MERGMTGERIKFGKKGSWEIQDSFQDDDCLVRQCVLAVVLVGFAGAQLKTNPPLQLA